MGVTAKGPPADWLDAALWTDNITRDQRREIAIIQHYDLRLPIWWCDGLPGRATWEACEGAEHGDRLKAQITSVLTGACAHDEVAPVDTLGTVLDAPVRVAWLCLGCDAQLPAEWE